MCQMMHVYACTFALSTSRTHFLSIICFVFFCFYPSHNGPANSSFYHCSEAKMWWNILIITPTSHGNSNILTAGLTLIIWRRSCAHNYAWRKTEKFRTRVCRIHEVKEFIACFVDIEQVTRQWQNFIMLKNFQCSVSKPNKNHPGSDLPCWRWSRRSALCLWRPRWQLFIRWHMYWKFSLQRPANMPNLCALQQI